jgi:hypothetical protein
MKNIKANFSRHGIPFGTKCEREDENSIEINKCRFLIEIGEECCCSLFFNSEDGNLKLINKIKVCEDSDELIKKYIPPKVLT